MEAILDSRTFDAGVLDDVVRVYGNPSHPQRAEAEAVLVRFRQDPESWSKVDTILSGCTEHQTKYLALQILDDVISFRWKTLQPAQREGIRSYLVQKIIMLSTDEAVMRAEALLINKMNLVLVQVLKQEWPTNWPTFIPDLVEASKTSEILCENNVHILRLLSEEVFDFSKSSMTAARASALKESMRSEFAAIFELLMFVLQAASSPSLTLAALNCLQRYVTWIPEQYIFETPLLEMVCMKYLPEEQFRVASLEVLTEVSALAKPEYNNIFELLYVGVMSQIVRVIPPDVNIRQAYAIAEVNADSDNQLFVRHLALFLTTFLKSHIELLEAESYRDALLSGVNYLVGISDVEDTEVFKICVEYWLRFASDLYGIEVSYDPRLALTTNSEGDILPPSFPSGVDALSLKFGGMFPPGAVLDPSTGRPMNPRKALYVETLSRVRELMIRHFAKPEEVLIAKDETGEYVRETVKDTDTIALYKVMKDTMVFLTHLDPKNTEELMLEKLAKQVDGSEWGFEPLNTLCWGIGSISGTMTETAEKHFLVTVIKDLLVLCETKKGKNNKAVVASNIMYVVGQYPRFLRAHWKFLRTVVMKLFEFMHEKHPGVQDMAVDTFLKISEKCKKKFVQLQVGEAMTFIEELCMLLPGVINDLEAHQIHTFYEAAGHMISAHPDDASREMLTERLMNLPNTMWARLMRLASDNIDSLRSVDSLKEIQRVLRTCVCACTSIGPSFAKQLGKLYLDMLNVYKAVSNFLNAGVASAGAVVMQHVEARFMTAVRKEALRLIGTYVKHAEDPKLIVVHFLPPLLEPVLGDFASAQPATREPEVLVLMTDIVDKLQGEVLEDAPKILGAVFESSLTMITANFHEYPEHRMGFFKLLESINKYCFPALFAIAPEQQKLIVDAVVWAIRHDAREIGETGLNILQGMLENIAASEASISQPFYREYFLSLIQDLLYVLTDRLHKAHFKQHAAILSHMGYLVDAGLITTPLWEAPAAVSSGAAAAFESQCNEAAAANGGVIPPDMLSNSFFAREFVRQFICTTFSNMAVSKVKTFVDNLFDTSGDAKAYKIHLRDFLIEVLEFKPDQDEGGDLFAEERTAAAQTAAQADEERRKAIPGLANPYAMLAQDYDAVDFEEL